MRHAMRTWVRHIIQLPIGILVMTIALVFAGIWYLQKDHSAAPIPQHISAENKNEAQPVETASEGRISFGRDSWASAKIQIHPVASSPFIRRVQLTGKIALNEDRVAHLHPMVEGRVQDVKVHLGDAVKKGDLLFTLQSMEVGKSMLQLFQDRMQHEFTRRKDEWTQMVFINTREMIDLLSKESSMDDIQNHLLNRPIGEYRDKLMSAYVAFHKARATWDRIKPLADTGAITGRQHQDTEAEFNASRSRLQSLLEQIREEIQQSAKLSSQALQDWETRVAVDQANLKILGFSDDSLANIDPAKQGEAISYYPMYAPFDGTVIDKDLVLMERVSPEKLLVSVADLSTVWVVADVYEEHLPMLHNLKNQSITIRCDAWPEKSFEAQIFYTGDLISESSRTVALRATADNREGLLKPGMFVYVEIPLVSKQEVVQVPISAVMEHSGSTFVFVHGDQDQFERRAVLLGMRNNEMVEIRQGLQPKEEVVTQGGFALKTIMLSELLSEE